MSATKSVIFWDFDGVLMNSNPIRDLGFEKVLNDFPREQVAQLMNFHRQNGGLSRYVKFRYFFETIRNEVLTDEKLKQYTDSFSKIMLELLLDEKLFIQPTLDFVKRNYQNYSMHIVSGSDQNELRIICKTLNIATYFLSINGSPIPKKQLVKDILKANRYDVAKCVLIGDSHNDYEAAQVNNIDFFGFGNPKIEEISTVNFSLA